MFKTILAALGLIVFCALSIGYTLLAGGNVNLFPVAVAFSPAVALFLWSLWSADRPIFFGVLFFFLLPILMNGLSILLALAGQEKIAGIVFWWRFLSMFVFLIGYAIVFVFVQLWADFRAQKLRESLKKL